MSTLTYIAVLTLKSVKKSQFSQDGFLYQLKHTFVLKFKNGF